MQSGICAGNRRYTGAVIGTFRWGSYALRGEPLAAHYGWERVSSRAKLTTPVDVAWIVKAGINDSMHRNAKRIIWDAMDIWSVQRSRIVDPSDYWLDMWKRYRFHDIIATSPACRLTMEHALPRHVRIHLVPHAADPRISDDWHDPEGPIVYAGHRHFIGKHGPRLQEAAERIGRKLVIDHSHNAWKSLQGASLQLCVRLASNAKLNRHCKPTIKVSNSAAAGVPALCTDDPAICSLWPELTVSRIQDWNDVETIAQWYRLAMASEPPKPVISHHEWLEKTSLILSQQQ